MDRLTLGDDAVREQQGMFRRRGSKVVVYRSKRPMNYLIFEPVHRRLAGDTRLDIRFCGKLHGQHEARRLYQLAGAGSIRLISNFLARYYPLDLYVSSDFNIVARRAARTAHMFHGVSFKNHAISESARNYDAVFVVGPYMERQFIQRGIFQEGDPRLRRVGMPKLDRLLDGSLSREAILGELGCEAGRPTVLYAPTWGQESSLHVMGEQVIRNLCGRGVNLVVKLHDNSYDPRKSEVSWADRLAELAHPDLTVARTRDVVPLLFVADVLVSDASSVSNEYLLMDRPIIFLKFPGQLDGMARADVETWGRKVGATVEDASEIASALEQALEQPERQHEIRGQAARDLFYGPGHATDRAVAEVYSLLELEAPHAADPV